VSENQKALAPAAAAKEIKNAGFTVVPMPSRHYKLGEVIKGRVNPETSQILVESLAHSPEQAQLAQSNLSRALGLGLGTEKSRNTEAERGSTVGSDSPALTFGAKSIASEGRGIEHAPLTKTRHSEISATDTGLI
jgi:hypothetical protein